MPLSEHEQRVLDELEQRVAAEDPEFGRKIGRSRRRRLRLVNAVVGLIVGLGLLALFCATTAVVVGVVSFLVMLASLLVLWGLSAERLRRS